MSAIFTQPGHPVLLEDELTALALQLEEINLFGETRKGKHPSNAPPDLEIAHASFHADIQTHLEFLKDVKLAHSIASAVNTDAQAIEHLTHEETQAQEDREYARQMSSDDPELEAPPPYTEVALDSMHQSLKQDKMSLLTTVFDMDQADVYSDEEDEAGPSVPYAQRQAEVLGKLSGKKFECCSCYERFRWDSINELDCKDWYCEACLKNLVTRAITDLAYMPPRCHEYCLSRDMITARLTDTELEDFDNAQLEKSTMDKTYCSNPECGRFIPPNSIVAGKAECPRCQWATCSMCKNKYHEDDCPADPELRATLELVEQRGWQRCFSCKLVVELTTGCNHMTCSWCSAEFCYICGTQWRRCSCEFATERNIVARAEEVVDREAPLLRADERQRRVQVVQQELGDENNECNNHYGRKKFRMIEHGGRQGFQCELCYDRHWKFILECKQCRIRVCMDCRRTRV